MKFIYSLHSLFVLLPQGNLLLWGITKYIENDSLRNCVLRIDLSILKQEKWIWKTKRRFINELNRLKRTGGLDSNMMAKIYPFYYVLRGIRREIAPPCSAERREVYIDQKSLDVVIFFKKRKRSIRLFRWVVQR